MLLCARCRNQIPETSRFCSVCGNRNGAGEQMQDIPAHQVSSPPLPNHAAVSARGFGQVFGLDPRIAFLTIVVDVMLFGGDIISLGASLLLSAAVGGVLGYITYKAQRHWYGDDSESAMIKGLIVGLLTAIPTSLPGFLTIPSGIVGLVHILRRKKRDNSFVIERRVGE